MTTATRAETIICALARQLEDGGVVATGVASPIPILAIAVARATHAPSLSYLACVGALNPAITSVARSSEDVRYLEGRTAEISIPDLFDHARRGRVDTVFFGAAEVDGHGRTNLTAAGPLSRPTVKLPGLAGAHSLRRWVRRPVLLVVRQSRRNLVARVQVASTSDARPTPLFTDLGVFEVGPDGARLVARHPWATVEEIADRTGFELDVPATLPVTPAPSEQELAALRAVDPDGFREELFG